MLSISLNYNTNVFKLNLLENCYHENLLFDHYRNLIQWNGAKTLIPNFYFEFFLNHSFYK